MPIKISRVFGLFIMMSVVLCAGTVLAEDASLFGLRVGMTKEDVKKLHTNMEFSPGSLVGIEDPYDLGNVSFRLNAVFSENGLDKTCGNFFHSMFDTITGVLKEKYGEGRVADTVVQNRAGAKFGQTNIIWAFPDGSAITAERYCCGELVYSRVCLMSGPLLESMGADIKKTADELKKGL